MRRHLISFVAAAGIAGIAASSPALAGCDCEPYEQVTPRYIVNLGPVYSGPGFVAPRMVYRDSPSADPAAYPYVRSYGGWYFVGARGRDRWYD